jgi:hypothetical protein
MNIILDSKEALDQFAEQTSKFTKIPKSRIKSAIAKGQGYNHITAFEAVLSPASVLTPSVALSALYDWLDDGQGGSIYFDNSDDGEIFCEQVIEALPHYPNTPTQSTCAAVETASPDILSDEDMRLVATALHAFHADVAASVCEMAEVGSLDELEMTHFEQGEDNLTDNASELGSQPVEDVIQAMMVLNRAGLTNMAMSLRALHVGGATYDVLRENV